MMLVAGAAVIVVVIMTLLVGVIVLLMPVLGWPIEVILLSCRDLIHDLLLEALQETVLICVVATSTSVAIEHLMPMLLLERWWDLISHHLLCLMAFVEGIAVRMLLLLLVEHLVICIEFDAIEGTHPVFVVARELLHDLLFLFDFVVDDTCQIMLDHND